MSARRTCVAPTVVALRVGTGAAAAGEPQPVVSSSTASPPTASPEANSWGREAKDIFVAPCPGQSPLPLMRANQTHGGTTTGGLGGLTPGQVARRIHVARSSHGHG